MMTLHGQQNYSKGTQTSPTEQTMPSTTLHCVNSSTAGSKADMFHIYSQESKSFVMSIISNSLESSRISLEKTYSELHNNKLQNIQEKGSIARSTSQKKL